MAKSFIFGAIVTLCLIQGIMCQFPDPTKFFTTLKDGEISRLVWKHAVNTEEEFTKTLKNPSIHLIEVDVIPQKTDDEGPLINHDLDKPSSFTLKKLLDLLKTNTTQGIKFDFKKFEAYEQSVAHITKAKLQIPVFFNADILKGPGGADPTGFEKFVEEVNKNFSTAILSAGWTTKGVNTSYTTAEVDTMVTAVSKFPGLKTYPVRASLVQNTNKSVFDKLLTSSTSTLTIWTAKDDKLNVESLKNFVSKVGKKRVYLDLPENIQTQINGSANIGINSFMILGAIFSYFMLF